jgi:hypothetical protein
MQARLISLNGNGTFGTYKTTRTATLVLVRILLPTLACSVVVDIGSGQHEFMDNISQPERTLVAVYDRALREGDACEGHVLVGTDVRRPDQPMPRSPHSVSAESARRETAAAGGFALATVEALRREARRASLPGNESPRRGNS